MTAAVVPGVALALLVALLLFLLLVEQTGSTWDDYFYVDNHPRPAMNRLLTDWTGPFLQDVAQSTR